jgi:methyl-accepting chemotaxis protein
MISAGKELQTAAASGELSRLIAGWSKTLDEVTAELGVISGTTEDEFLAIGARLQDFLQRGSGIASVASEMVGEVAGEHVTAAMSGLRDMMGMMGAYVNRSQHEIEDSAATLREILRLLDEVSGPLSGFKKVNKVLKMLGISTKIESARLGAAAAGFETLASDVGDLSVQVNDKATVILARKDELARTISQTLSGVLDTGARQHDQVIAILEKSNASLEALTGINSRCSSAVTGISLASEEVSARIGDVVMSMQTHDIVRQQIEHVQTTLKELDSRLVSGQAGADDAVCICDLQTAQLRHARSEFEHAVLNIVGSLREIARKEADLSAQTRGMAGIADQAGGSFFTEMEKDISVVSEALLESTKVNQSLCQAMNKVVETVGEIANFVGDIETIGEEIKLIALNAQIQSAYTGEEGAALGVLAEAIQRLSIDAIAHTGAVSETLQAIIGVTRKLHEGVSSESSVLEDEVREMVEKLSALLDSLRLVNESLRRSLSQMEQEVLRICSDVEQVTAGITVQQKVDAVLDKSLRSLEGLVSEARPLAPGALNQATLDEIAKRYTMASQRQIHQSHFDPKAALGAASESEGDFGGNVELF